MSTTVTLQLHPTADQPGTLTTIAQTLGISAASIQPLAPGSKDAQMARYFALDAEDDAGAHALAARLRGMPSIAAAYVKSKDAPARP